MTSIKNLNYAPRVNVASDWQAALLAQLKVLDRICAEHGITYSIAFGGLLGAVRHRGFIPWDNDVDVVMSEDNYNRFRQLALDGKLPEGYGFVDRVTEPGYPLLFGRFINENTSCPLSTSSFNGGRHGLFIDVFILFPLPDEPEAQERAVTAFLVWEQLMCIVKRRSKYRNERFVREWRRLKDYERTHGRTAALEHAEKEFRALIPAFGESTWCLHGSGGAFNGFGRLKSEWFTQPIRIAFEDAELCAPSDPVGFFEQRYGFGWRTCPVGERYKTYSGADLNIPYHVITADYMHSIDRDQAIADFKAYTELRVEEAALLNEARVPRLKALAELHAAALSDEAASLSCVALFSGPDVAHTTPEQALAAIAELKKIDALMHDKDLRTWHIAPPIREDVLAAILWARFIAYPEYWDVKKSIRVNREDREHTTFGSADACTRLERALSACRDLYYGIDFNDATLIETACATLDELAPNTVHARIANAYALSDDPIRCLAYLDGQADDVRNHEYLQWLRVNTLIATGKTDLAADAMRTLADATNNGMLMLAINDLAKAKGFNICAKPKNTPPAKRHIPKNSFRSLRSFGIPGIKASLKPAIRKAAAKEEELERIRERMKPYKERIARYHSIRRISSERFKTWETMFPRRELLAKAASTGDPAEIIKIDRAYVEASYRVYDGENAGLFIDRATLDATLPYFAHDRGQDFVDDFISKIPAPHREDIDAMLRRLGIDHPYLR